MVAARTDSAGTAENVVSEEGGGEVEKSLWVEIRIPSSYDGECMNLENVYRWVRNSAQGKEDIFEFAVMGKELPQREGIWVRYFMKAPDYDRKQNLVSNLEAGGFSVYEVPTPPGFSKYDRELEFEMEDDFAIPLVPAENFERDNYPEIPKGLASAVRDGGAFRMVIRGDDNARNDIQRFINKEEGRGGDPFSVFVGLFDNLTAGRTTDGVPKTREERSFRGEETEYSRLAKERKNRRHALCEFRAYGSDEQIRNISKSFGFGINDIVEKGDYETPESGRKDVEDKLRRAAEAIIESRGTVPETEEERENLGEALSDASDALKNYREEKLVPERPSRAGLLKLLVLLPFLLPVSLAYFGFWDPLKMLEFSSTIGFLENSWPVLAAVIAAVGVWRKMFGGGGNPIVLTENELALIGSLPAEPQGLPVLIEAPSVPGPRESPEEESEQEEAEEEGEEDE